MNLLEQFIINYQPEGHEKNIVFRQILEQVIQENKPVHEVIGMRDYFAAKFIPEICKHSELNGWNYEKNAKICYTMADAMMKARENDS